MSTLDVYTKGRHVAAIVKIPRAADAYRAAEPWALLHNTGRVDRFTSQSDAKDEARKAWPASEFRRGLS